MPKISVGLDLGFSSIKIVSLEKDKQFKLLSLGSIPAPSPGMVSDAEPDLEKVAAAIKQLYIATKIEEKEIVAALPESKVFTRVIDDLPYLTDAELASAIKYAAEEFIPMPLTEVNLNWQVLLKTKEHNMSRTVVLVIASPKNVVAKYVKVLTMAGLKVKALETETIAVTRSLVGNNPYSPTSLIMQMGATTTDFAVISKGLIWLTRSISSGGDVVLWNFGKVQSRDNKV